MIQHKIHETSWFFFVMMIVLFIVSYLFWGFLFGVIPGKGSQGPMQRGLYNNVNAVPSQQPQGGFPGMGGGGRRMQGQGQSSFQGGSNRNSTQGGSNRNSTQGGSNRMSTTSIR